MKKGIITLLLIIGVFVQVSAQKNYKNYTYFLYTIAKNVQWPTSNNNKEFVIGVYGESELIPHLNEMASSKRINGKQIKVVKVNSASEIKDFNMLFVPEAKSNELFRFLGKVTSNSTLVITEKPGMGRKGSGVNFITQSGKLEFELNVAALKSANLKISSDLVRFAQVL